MVRGVELLLLLAPVCAATAPLPECTIPRATSSISVDGRLDEAAWGVAWNLVDPLPVIGLSI